jgi:lipopolysaccharide biosynthesis protein
MDSICFFASYFTGPELPYYTTVYLKELRRHFPEVVMISSNTELSEKSKNFLQKEMIGLLIEANEGYDFGQWYKALQKYNFTNVKAIALVNDSTILFKPLDKFMEWANSDGSSVQGMTFSEAVAPHLQSYFILIRKPAIQDTLNFFKSNGILKNISDVITTYEIGLSSFLLSKGHKMSAFVDNNHYKGEFSPYYYCIKYHLSKGIPLIKKKILFSSYRKDELFTLARMDFEISVDYYLSLMKNSGGKLLAEPSFFVSDAKHGLTGFERMRYNLLRKLIKVFRPFYKILKFDKAGI